MEAVRYVEENETGTVVVSGTRTHVSALGFAHEDGASEEALLGQFSLNREQLHGALAYFYGHREELINRISLASKLAEDLSQETSSKMQKWREMLKK